MTAGASPARDLRVLQRVVFPGDDLDVVPLYVETNPDRGAAELAAELANEALTGAKAGTVNVPVATAPVAETQSSIRFGSDVPGYLVDDAGPRRSALIAEGRRVSFATYFNAFPASYWRRYTTVDSVTLRIRLAGQSKIVLYRSTARGFSHPVETIDVESDQPEVIQRTLPLSPFIDGGWYWFDIIAGPGGTTLIEADWLGSAPGGTPGRVSLGITTFNQPDFMIEQLHRLGEAADTLDLLDRVYVIDQGSDKVTHRPGFDEAARSSVTCSRSSSRGTSAGQADSPARWTRRCGRGAPTTSCSWTTTSGWTPRASCGRPHSRIWPAAATIVGGHMFSMYDRSLLHAFAEAIEPHKWWWGPSPNTKARHDFGRRNLRNTPWLHRRAEADYNGWWMCLIPTAVIREIGLSMPVFIEWDDAEYRVRAGIAAFRRCRCQGVAAWQVPWDDKDDARNWQAYYHLRNRLVSALLHSPAPKGGAVISESLERQLQSLLSMQYSTVALRLLAVEDVLTGPGHMHREIATKLPQLRQVRAPYTDAKAAADLESFPPPRRKAPDELKHSTTPTNKLNLMTKAAAGTIRQFRRAPERARKRPQMALPYQDAGWWVLANLDSVLVSAAEGTSAAWYQRDPKLFRSLGWRSLVAHRRLRRNWARLAKEYRDAAPDFNSPERWRETFAASVSDSPSDQ